MSYQVEHLTWQQRVGHEFLAYKQHLNAVANEQHIPMTRSNFVDPKMNSNYAHCYSHLMTLDQIRKKNSFVKSQKNGLSAFGFDRDGKMVDQPINFLTTQSRGTASHKNLNKQIRQTAQISPSKSIYNLVKQEIKMPDGLLFRGKYVGQSRSKKNPDEQSVKSVSKISQRKRPTTAQTRSSRQDFESNNDAKSIRQYLPEEYYRRSGYSYVNPNSVSEARTILNPQILKIMPGEDFRFNETVNMDKKRSSLMPKKLKKLKNQEDLDKLSIHSKGSKLTKVSLSQKSRPSTFSKKSNPRSGYLKRISTKDGVNGSIRTNDIIVRLHELQKLTTEPTAEEKPEDPVLPEQAEELQSVAPELKSEEDPAEEAPQDDKTTVVTHMTNKTQISQLQNDLAEERVARERLEKELEEIKQITVEIQSKIQSTA